ncbi:Aldo/keto reductase [Mycena rebaudengoi]|nr:Aldo/keto reductase [Mycena rebaudengoi]
MPSFWDEPKPASELGNYRVPSPLAGIHVSPIQLGAMSIGDKWVNLGMGAMDKESSFKLLDAYFDNGGNLIDTANNYQDESSEAFIGEWAEKRNIRNQLVIATKYSTNYKRGNDIAQKVFYVGNSVKSMHISVEASLKKLRTTYIDSFYLHWWDWATGVEEVMNGLHNLVVQGKVLYLLVVAKANQYAQDHGKTPFVIYQGMWNILDHSFEREIIPMARPHGLALAPWAVLAGGKTRTDKEEEERRKTGSMGKWFWDHLLHKMGPCRRCLDDRVSHPMYRKTTLTSVPAVLCLSITTKQKCLKVIENAFKSLEVLQVPCSFNTFGAKIFFDPSVSNSFISDAIFETPRI